MSRTHQGGFAALRLAFMLAAGLLLLATTIVPASAQYGDVISACGQKCQTGGCGADTSCRTAVGGKCKLTANVSCTSSDSTIQLIDGTDLDLQGYDITCTSGLCNYWAITMYAAGSKVTNASTTDTLSVISGPFATVIGCGGYSSTIVEDITVSSTAVIGIGGCQTVRHNVIDGLGSGTWGVIVTGTSSSDSVSDNFLTGYDYPVVTTSTQTIDLLRNVINTSAAVTAITLGSGVSTTNGNVKRNVFFGGASSLFAATTTDNNSYDGNYCDPNESNCSTCISSTQQRCESYTSPFQGN